jgi:hypothetical protein
VSGLYSIPNALLAQQVGMVLNVDSYKKWDKKKENVLKIKELQKRNHHSTKS